MQKCLARTCNRKFQQFQQKKEQQFLNSHTHTANFTTNSGKICVLDYITLCKLCVCCVY